MNKAVYILLGFLQLALGVLLAGAGHGWVTGMLFSFLSILVFLSLAMFCLKSKVFCLSLILLNAIATTLMIVKTKQEGVNYFAGVWNSVSPLVAIYFILWFSWLVIPIVSLIRNKAIK